MNTILPMMTALSYIVSIHKYASHPDVKTGYWSHEQNRIASNSEIRRWIDQGAIVFNNEKVLPTEMLDFPIYSVIMFPKSGKRRITIF